MPIPEWVNKWIERLDDPAQNVILLTSDEDRFHTSWCRFRQGNECNCAQEYHATGNENEEIIPPMPGDPHFGWWDDLVTPIIPVDDWE